MLARIIVAFGILAAGCAVKASGEIRSESNLTPKGGGSESAATSNLIDASVPPPRPNWTDEVDFLALREAYGARTDYGERCEDSEVAHEASSALNREAFLEVVELTRNPLERCPVWAQLHLWRGAALFSLGRDAEGEVHKRWFLGLTDSILDSGDGKTAETAFRTVSIPEEYAVLARLGLKRESQALIDDGPGMVDVITATDEDGRARTVYFNPSWHFIRLINQIQAQ